MKAASLNVKLDHDLYFEKYRLDIHFPPYQPYKPSLLERIGRAIQDFFIRLCEVLCFWKTPTRFRLTDRQLKLIEQCQVTRPHLNVKMPSVLSLVKPPIAPAQELHYPEEKTLNQFCQFVERLAEVLLIRCLNEELILPSMDTWKKLAIEGIAKAKQWIALVSDLKSAATPFFKGFGLLEDPSLTILAQQVLQVLLTPLGEEGRQKLEEILYAKTKDLFASGEITEVQYESILAMIEPTLRWLFNSNNWLIKSSRPVVLHHCLIDTGHFIDSFADQCKKGAFDPIFLSLSQQIQEGFGTGTQELLKLNTKPFANMVSRRLAALLADLPFQELFDAILKQASLQINAWVEANQAKQSHCKLIENAAHDARQHATNEEEVSRQNKAMELIKRVQAAGGKSRYLQKMFHIAFAASPGCHPQINKLVYATCSPSDLLNQIAHRFVEQLLTSLLPNEFVEVPGGGLVEISGVMQFVRALHLPKEFQHMYAQIEKLLDLAFKHGQFENKDSFTQFFSSFKEILASQFIHQQLTKGLVEGFVKFIEEFSDKDFLDSLMAEYVLPDVIELIFRDFVKVTFKDKIKHLSPILVKYIEQKGDDTLVMIALTDTLYELMQKQTLKFCLVKNGIGKERFRELIAPLLEEILGHVLIKYEPDLSDKSKPVHQIEAVLAAYLTPPQAETVPYLGDILFKSLFDIGQFKLSGLGNGTETVLKWFKNLIIQECSASMNTVRRSYHELVEAIILSEKKGSLDPEKLRKVLFPKTLTLQQKEAQQKSTHDALTYHFSQMSCLLHDFIYRSIEAVPLGGIWKHATPNPNKIHEALCTIYENLFEDSLLNKNLLILVVETVCKFLRSPPCF